MARADGKDLMDKMEASKEVVKKPASVTQMVKHLLAKDDFKKRFQDMLGEKSAGFMSSVVSYVSSDINFQEVDPVSIVSSAAIAATLDLPIDRNLGFAAIVPYKQKGGIGKAQFQMMYKGFVQLAIRTGQYSRMNVSEVYEDELAGFNPLTGDITFTDMDTWEQRGHGNINKIVGYYAYFKLLNGFEQGFYMTKKQIEAHGKRYSRSYDSQYGKWKTDFDAMAKKTVLKLLLSKWGILSIEMQKALGADQAVVSQDGEYEYIDGTDGLEIEGPKENKDFQEMEKLEQDEIPDILK
jgi:recombination protein RecT